MIGRARTNIRALIEDQYEILSQMISDVAEHYHDEVSALEREVNEIYNKYANSDYETFSNETQGLGDVLDKQYSFCYEARKILFCAIFSYFESMLYGIISYYRIDRGKTNQIGQLIDKITNQYKKWFNEELVLSDDLNKRIRDFYRPLRNYYMHGVVDSETDKANLRTYIDSNSNFIGNYHEIKDNEFLRCVLSESYSFLIDIEDAYVAKMTEKRWAVYENT